MADALWRDALWRDALWRDALWRDALDGNDGIDQAQQVLLASQRGRTLGTADRSHLANLEPYEDIVLEAPCHGTAQVTSSADFGVDLRSSGG